jgi:hypothetical protein
MEGISINRLEKKLNQAACLKKGCSPVMASLNSDGGFV